MNFYVLTGQGAKAAVLAITLLVVGGKLAL